MSQCPTCSQELPLPIDEPRPICYCGNKMDRVTPYLFCYHCSKCGRDSTEQEFVIHTGIRKKEIVEWEKSRRENLPAKSKKRAGKAPGEGE